MNSKCNLTKNLFKKILIFLLVILNFGFASAERYLHSYILGTGKSKNTLLVQTIDGQLFLSKTNKPYDFEKNCGCSIYIDDKGKASLILPNGTSAPATKILETDSTILEFIKQSDEESNENTKKPRIKLSQTHEEKILKTLGYKSPKKFAEGGCGRVYKDEKNKNAIKVTSSLSRIERINANALTNIPNLKAHAVIPKPKACIGSSEIFEMSLCDHNGLCYMHSAGTYFRSHSANELAMLENLLKIAQKIANSCLEFFETIHKNDLMHLDFKMENILVDYPDGAVPRFRVADFGTVVDWFGRFGGNRYQTGTITRFYADEENLKANTLESLKYADMYSLGSSLYDRFSLTVNRPSELPMCDDGLSPDDFRNILNNLEKNMLRIIRNTVYNSDDEITDEYIEKVLKGEKIPDARDNVAIELFYFLNFIIRLTTPNMSERMNVQQALNHQFLNIKF